MAAGVGGSDGALLLAVLLGVAAPRAQNAWPCSCSLLVSSAGCSICACGLVVERVSTAAAAAAATAACPPALLPGGRQPAHTHTAAPTSLARGDHGPRRQTTVACRNTSSPRNRGAPEKASAQPAALPIADRTTHRARRCWRSSRGMAPRPAAPAPMRSRARSRCAGCGPAGSPCVWSRSGEGAGREGMAGGAAECELRLNSHVHAVRVVAFR